MAKKYSIKQDFTFFSFLVIVVTICLSIAISLQIYSLVKTEQTIKFEEKSKYIDQFLNDTFDHLSHYTTFIGKTIVSEKLFTPESIAQLLKIKSQDDMQSKAVYSWTVFDWIDKNKKLIVSAKLGVLKSPIDMSHRTYAEKALKTPWKLMFSDPAIGIPSKQMIIPMGIGITDNTGHIFGIIGTGISTKTMGSKIEQVINKQDTSFIILNDQFKIVTASSNINFEQNMSDILTQILLKKNEIEGAKYGAFDEKLKYQNVILKYFKKVDNYPFYIIVGEDVRIANAKFFSAIIPRVSELIFMGLVCVLLLYYLRKRLVSPIVSLSSVASRIAKEKKHIEVEEIRYEEINTLATKLMEIQQVKKQLIIARELKEHANDVLEEKVMQRTRELEKALSIKNEFFNNLSHEVRTPIQGITAIAQGLTEHWNQFTDQKKLEYVINLERNSKRLFDLVDNILNISDYNTAKSVLEISSIDIIHLVDEMIEECRTLYLKNAKIKIIFEHDVDKLFVDLDKEKITQVLRNLFLNAIKFTQNGDIIAIINSGEITINRKVLPAVRFVLKDQGVGIPNEELVDIFSPFIQSTRTKNRSGGKGLGLTIAKNIIEMHYGEIWAENNEVKGASFNFVIPVHYNKILQITKNTAKLAINEQHDVQQNGLNILLIDDEEACIISTKILLHSSEHNLVAKMNGYDGLKYLQDNPNMVDVIMLDMMLPDIYGLDLLVEIKKNELLKHKPVILQTGIMDDGAITKAFELGIDSYLIKPYTKEKLLAELKRVA